MQQDAAESVLSGDVGVKRSGGVIRYRIWPAKRHPVRLLLALTVVIGATVAGALVFDGVFWAFVIAVALTGAAALFFFPTEVNLDGHNLNIRQFGTPRVWDLTMFQRVEVASEVLPRAELLSRARLSPVDTIRGVTVPLPEDKEAAGRVLVHLRRWVGRRPTGRFALDADHAPEDTVDVEDAD